MKHIYYALHHKGFALVFSCHARTRTMHEERVRQAFQSWQGAQPKGNKLTMDDYMKDRTRVEITVKYYHDT